jgi:predicted cupin superfamily sugar epimerase
LGNDVTGGDRPQVVVPAKAWFGAGMKDGEECVPANSQGQSMSTFY